MSVSKKSQEPSRYLSKLSTQLFSDESDRLNFIANVMAGRAASPATLWLDEIQKDLPFQTLEKLPHQPEFIVRIKPGERPGKTSLHDEGAFYIFDYASALMSLPLLNLDLESPHVLDLCASPGGKTIFASRALNPGRLVSNEVIGKRLAALKSNLRRCKVSADVTSADPEDWAKSAADEFDVVIVDAPCSGQSLVAKGESAPGCFHPANVNSCMKRQRRIIANAVKCIKPNGYLMYSTCTYSMEENEEIIEWILKKTPDLKTEKVVALERFQSKLTQEFAYRFFPDTDYGAGGFTCLIKRG